MKRYIMPSGAIGSFPDDCTNFADEHPIHIAREISESEFEQEMETRKPPERKPDYKEKRRAEYPDTFALAEAISEKELGQPQQMIDYLAKVVAVKQKYPKDI